MVERAGEMFHDYAFGKLIPIGGAARDVELKVVVDEVGDRYGMSIITAPTSEPDKVFTGYAERFDRVGIKGEIFHLRVDLNYERAQEMLEASSVVFITGGNQVRGKNALERQRLNGTLKDFYNNGGVIAGTSAGASLIGEWMPFYNDIAEGLGLLSGVIIDQHFEESHREERLMRAVSEKHNIGIGISEGTGIIFDSGSGKVFGKGAVHLMVNNGREVEDLLYRNGEIIVF